MLDEMIRNAAGWIAKNFGTDAKTEEIALKHRMHRGKRYANMDYRKKFNRWQIERAKNNMISASQKKQVASTFGQNAAICLSISTLQNRNTYSWIHFVDSVEVK